MAEWNPRVNEIFARAIELPSADRRLAYLQEACGEDALVRMQVDALLRAHDAAGGFLLVPEPGDTEATVEHLAQQAERHAPGEAARLLEEQPGTRIGFYKLLEKIGEGGMGTVFMAEQEHPVRRTVALKVIKAGMDTGQVVARFEAERQALAIMDHQNIARVFDAGATQTGRPFFVMELVKGVPITEYCDRNNLSPKERLALFIPVCEAIQHAHQKGIIHRDIKPSNVLVTLYDGKPVPKIIDFGVAKAIAQRLTEKTMFTQHGAIVGTLEYMSPEQAEISAVDIDTRSDIYSLGVLLYELLTGSTPLQKARLRQAAYSEILRRIREEDPPKPSTRLSTTEELPSIAAHRSTEPARLSKLMRGELDWIVMRALEKDRTRRYDTAIGFARDIQRYLDGDPVEAGPPSASYKLKKFARKHRAAFATVGAFAIVLVAATAISVASALRANRERKRAENREQIAIDAVKRFHEAIANESELKKTPALGGLRTRLLKEPLPFFRDLRDRLQADRDTRPESLARLAQASFDLGNLTDDIGDRQDALIALREALAIFQKLAEANPRTAAYASGVAKCQNNIGAILGTTNETAAAMKAHESARAIRQRLADANPTVNDFQRDLALSYSNIGSLLGQSGKRADARKAHEAALAIHQKLAAANPKVADFLEDLAGSHNSIGILRREAGEPVKALESYEAASAIRKKLADANRSAPDYQRALAHSQGNLGSLLRELGKPAEALRVYAPALTILQKLADDNPTVTDYQRDLASINTNIAVLLKDKGEMTAAVKAWESALAITEKLTAANPTVTDFQRSLAVCYNNLAGALTDAGKPTDALPLLFSALSVRQKLADANPTITQFQTDLALSHYNIGLALSASGKPAEAMKAYRSGLAIHQKLADANPTVPELQSHVSTSLDQIGVQLRADGKPSEALRSHESALAIREKIAAANPTVAKFQRMVAISQNNIAILLRNSGKPTEALKAYESALAIQQKLADTNPNVIGYQHELAASKSNIGVLLNAIGKPAAAMKEYESALAISEPLARAHPELPECASVVGATLHNIAEIELSAKRFEEARDRLRQAIAWDRKALASNPRNRIYRQNVVSDHLDMIKAARGLGDSKGIADAESAIQELRDSDPAMAVIDARLAQVMKGAVALNDNAERLRLAQRAYDKALYVTAARLFSEVIDASAKLGDERPAPARYNAACAATLAVGGAGRDQPQPDDAAKATLRAQTLEWLTTELAAWKRVSITGAAGAKETVARTLTHWKNDADLASIRDDAGVASLPEPDRNAFRKLWADVDALRAEVAGSK
jgi:serine/threonine protein kinase